MSLVFREAGPKGEELLRLKRKLLLRTVMLEAMVEL